MRIYIILFICELISFTAFCQTNTFPSSGNVGIGTLTPRATLEVGATNGVYPSIVSGSVIEVAGYREVAQSANVSVTGGTLNNGGPTSRNGMGNWTVTSFPVTITICTRGWWSFGGISFTADNVFNYPNGGGAKLPSSFLIEASPDAVNWTTVDDVTGYTSALYYNPNVITGSGACIRITARAPQSGETISKIANIQIYDTYRTGKGPFTVSPEGNAVFIGGNVGIGVINPQSSLDINGGINANTESHFATGSYVDPNPGFANALKIGSGGIAVNGNSIFPNGTVGINTNNTQGYQLAVNGSAICTKLVVKQHNNWPDFVFDSSYHLQSLTKVEEFLKLNKHLPEMPSSKEVENSGVDVGETERLLLKKIEELTLYMIEVKKENTELKKRIENLENKK